MENQFSLRKSVLLIFSLFFLLQSCGQIEDVLDDDEVDEPDNGELVEEEDVDPLDQPDWYTENRPYKTEDGFLKTAASSIGQDSSRVSDQAVEISQSRLINGIARIMENLREEVGDNSGDEVDLSSFIQLRYELDAEELGEIAELVKHEVNYEDTREHYQAYVYHRIGSDELSSFLITLLQNSDLAWITDEYDIASLVNEIVESGDVTGVDMDENEVER